MDKTQLRKNRLDLEYHGEAQKANAFLILATTGCLAFFGTFIWLDKTKFFAIGIIITISVLGLAYAFYRKTNQRMKQILIEVEMLG